MHTKIEIFAEESDVEAITKAIIEVGQSTVPGAGIVAVIAVERFLHLHVPRERQWIQPNDPNRLVRWVPAGMSAHECGEAQIGRRAR
ncbi:P-II family nitrogen regulator [Cupriavidus campinensis]|uniref:hypothetical protein n=1 Tax=Cupriavidus campinensis TaxID=151783 RepID=UPI0021CC6186|nr:hypothetical protein [Cupriavidus campinensis]